jgi:hypothetical protein
MMLPLRPDWSILNKDHIGFRIAEKGRRHTEKWPEGNSWDTNVDSLSGKSSDSWRKCAHVREPDKLNKNNKNKDYMFQSWYFKKIKETIWQQEGEAGHK